MGPATLGIVLACLTILFGGLVTWRSVWAVRRRAERDGRGVIAALVARPSALGERARSSSRNWRGAVQLWFGLIFGPIVCLLGIVNLAGRIGLM